MSVIKKIKQFINGSWQEFSLNSSVLDNVATQEWVKANTICSSTIDQEFFNSLY